MVSFQPSLFEEKFFQNRRIYFKRDDLLDVDFSGNKARKFYAFLVRDFPHIRRVVSSGSNQSNAMYSLSVLAKKRGWEFIYVCDHIPSFLKQNPIGNYAKALENGMRIFESSSREVALEAFLDSHTLHVKEGGRQKEAEEGVALLAQELVCDVAREHVENPYLFLPSGTGTTALFLQKHLPFKVYTCATVGDSAYLRRQWESIEVNVHVYPTILETHRKYCYGKLYRELFEVWKTVQTETGVTFDLVYDPLGWKVLIEHLGMLTGTPIYLHQGGLLGNTSMLQRYARKAIML